MNNLKQISKLMAFTLVAEKGSFTKAGEYLGISKSAVSQQVKSLEDELGVRVLNRNTRGVSPTALGIKLINRCNLLQDQVDLIFSEISNAEDNPSGRFSVTFPHSLESMVVLPAIEQLCAEFPLLEPELIATDESLDLIEDKLDIAIHAGELSDSTYRALPVGTIKEIFCATPFFLNREYALNKANEITKYRWIATSWQKPKMQVLDLTSNEIKTIKLNQYARVNTLPNAINMALRHMGIILIPDVTAFSFIKSGELIHINNTLTGPLWPLYTIHAYRKDKPIHFTRFHQLICRQFEQSKLTIKS
ncbi:LysR family transcriptional regulator [Shewanella glacialimarina]|uniref:LysR family transcriptional regulator n=1 Tax=Shewanella glacialimarina TaxID=2590884 RepID=UPI001CF85A5E|nr:LysR family transcriptional regulator [Shewanella glacialimarina]UCX05743.1 LysR family transcriptional regulator [Shewanella glacialimarina]